MEAFAIAIVTASVAVALSEWGARCRHRREAVEAATLELPMVIPRVLVGMGDPQDGFVPIDTSNGSDWDVLRERTLVLHSTVRVMARPPMLRARKIRMTVEREAARLVAAEIDFTLNQRRLRKTEIFDHMSSDLHTAVFGHRGVLDNQIRSSRLPP